MITRLLTIGMLVIAVLLSGCSRGPEDAKSDLSSMKIEYNEQSFVNAIANNDMKAVPLFLEAGMSPNATVPDGTPLLVATLTANLEMTKFLIDKGANVNEKEKDGMTPLMGAILREDKGADQQNIVKLLIQKGADVNAPYVVKGQPISPLTMATLQKEVEIMKMLKDAGAK